MAKRLTTTVGWATQRSLSSRTEPATVKRAILLQLPRLAQAEERQDSDDDDDCANHVDDAVHGVPLCEKCENGIDKMSCIKLCTASEHH